jgi:hypothetical protein
VPSFENGKVNRNVARVLVSVVIAAGLGVWGFSTGWLALSDQARPVGRLRPGDLQAPGVFGHDQPNTTTDSVPLKTVQPDAIKDSLAIDSSVDDSAGEASSTPDSFTADSLGDGTVGSTEPLRRIPGDRDGDGDGDD